MVLHPLDGLWCDCGWGARSRHGDQFGCTSQAGERLAWSWLAVACCVRVYGVRCRPGAFGVVVVGCSMSWWCSTCLEPLVWSWLECTITSRRLIHDSCVYATQVWSCWRWPSRRQATPARSRSAWTSPHQSSARTSSTTSTSRTRSRTRPTGWGADAGGCPGVHSSGWRAGAIMIVLYFAFPAAVWVSLACPIVTVADVEVLDTVIVSLSLSLTPR